MKSNYNRKHFKTNQENNLNNTEITKLGKFQRLPDKNLKHGRQLPQIIH